jgi:LacI family transcriptional regulator
MATIYEVAKLAGVSPATVSRVFNGSSVSEEKSEAVRVAARNLKFTPNRAARALRTQTSEVIALVIPDIENPYFTEMARGVEDVAQQAGYSVVLCNSDADITKEESYLRIAVAGNMAGVIIAAASPHTTLDEVLAAGKPVVEVDRRTGYALDGVMMDNRVAGRLATEALLDAGYRNIACIAGPDDVETAIERVAGWRDALLRRRSGSTPESLVRHSSFRVDGGRAAMAELLDDASDVDAIVAGNNLIGVGALQLLSERGLLPPAIGVAVIGSLPFTTLSPDAVTVIRLPARDMGMTAAQMLLMRIGGDTKPARTVSLHGEVLVAGTPQPIEGSGT